ncbi:MAG: hypothetical protein NC040_06690 [Muribaculaceae bacterium]|nr:hypothetical protein [Alistipes senegalensis]MCM1473727.1 hypothetical protein [Muribaculaceae bacterium]MDE6427279.1 hypothetical protein [Ruminococcus sp.]
MTEFSYKNIYGSKKYNEFIERQHNAIDDKFVHNTRDCELSDGFSVEFINYSDKEHKDKSYNSVASKIILRNANKKIYEYYCFYSHCFVYTKIIHHKNGHRYYPFHVDRYGISFLDVDTFEVYNYIPEGYKHNDDRICGESFIINYIDYDIESNLIAYGGYYRSDSFEVMNDVMVGDFSEPLNFNPHLISLCDIFDYDDIYFREWKDDKLYVMCDNEEKSLSIDELKEKINELTMKGK